ncbi:MAG: hypothetical protein WCK17_11310 [Verrucomicrobiota bacterium]
MSHFSTGTAALFDRSLHTLKPRVMVRVLQRRPVREIRTPGSARGLSGNRQFYLNVRPAKQGASGWVKVPAS